MATLLHHLLDRAANNAPGKEAVARKDERLTFAGLHELSGNCAAMLKMAGLRRRDRVAIHLEKSVAECAAIFGVSHAGGVFVPLNSLLRPAQVAYILADCEVRFLITDSTKWNQLVESGDPIATVEQVFLVDEGASGDSREVPNALRELRPAPPQPDSIGEDLAAILYTSGSTGRAKGVMLSHRNLLAGSRIVSEYLEIREDDRILSVLPFSFDYGLNQLISGVDRTAAVVLLTFRFGNEIVRAIEEERITGLAGVPTLWAVLANAAPKFHRQHLETLRYLTNSGGAVPTETLQKLRSAQPHVDVVLMYGLTEAFRSTYLPPEELDRRPTSMGRAIPETEVMVLRPDGSLCEPGEPGVLVHRGPTVSLGYWGRPEDTARVIRVNPHWPAEKGGDAVCYSGDLVTMDEEGFLYFVGRDDAMIKSSGYRISPTEVEEVLMGHGSLAQAAVIGVKDPVAGERVHAICVPAPDARPDQNALLAHCGASLPSYMVPCAIEFAGELPRSPNGKVDYKQLKHERRPTDTKS